jgi:hypothetical protein
MMDTTSSIKKGRIKKENKLQITKITKKKPPPPPPPPPKVQFEKVQKMKRNNATVVGLLPLKDASKPFDNNCMT